MTTSQNLTSDDQPAGESVEDYDVLVKGSVLDKYLRSVPLGIDTLLDEEDEKQTEIVQRNVPQNNEVACNGKWLQLAMLILKSELLFEEDANLLKNYYPTLLENQTISFSRKNIIVIASSSSLAALTTFTLCKNLTWSVLTMLATSATTGLYFFLESYAEKAVDRQLKCFLQLLTEVTTFCRQKSTTIKDVIADLNSKCTLQRLQREKFHSKADFYSELNSDVAVYSKSFCKFMVDVIAVFKDATQKFFSNKHISSEYKTFFVANLEELNVSIGDVEITMDLLTKLCNCYILMQSEYLRALGMWLTSPYQMSPVQIESYLLEQIENINEPFSHAKRFLGHGIYTKYINPGKPLVKNSTMENHFLLFNLSSSITSLLNEAYNLKLYLSKHETILPGDEERFTYAVQTLESDMATCAFEIKKIQMTLARMKAVGNETGNINGTSDIDHSTASQPTVTGIEVGHSDFSVQGDDQVYMCIIERELSKPPINTSEHIEFGEKFPVQLLNELKFAIEERRVQFKDRESEAVKKSDCPDISSEFELLSLDMPPVLSSTGDHTKKSTSHKGKYSDGVESDSINNLPLNFEMTKGIALRAAEASASFMTNEEFVFGTDSEDDGDNDG